METVDDDEEEEEEMSGPNFDEWEGEPPNSYSSLDNFDNYPNIGEEEDDPEEKDANPTEWKETKMRARHFR